MSRENVAIVRAEASRASTCCIRTPPMRRPSEYVWTSREGRAVRFQWFNNPTRAMEAAGLRDS